MNVLAIGLCRCANEGGALLTISSITQLYTETSRHYVFLIYVNFCYCGKAIMDQGDLRITGDVWFRS